MANGVKTAGSENGFTLLEVVVAVAILSTSLVALLSAHNRALLMEAEAVRLTEIVSLAREEMERLYLKPLPEAGVSELRKREDYPRYQWRTEIKETPFNGAWEVAVLVFEAGDDGASDLFTLKAYVRK